MKGTSSIHEADGCCSKSYEGAAEKFLRGAWLCRKEFTLQYWEMETGHEGDDDLTVPIANNAIDITPKGQKEGASSDLEMISDF